MAYFRSVGNCYACAPGASEFVETMGDGTNTHRTQTTGPLESALKAGLAPEFLVAIQLSGARSSPACSARSRGERMRPVQKIPTSRAKDRARNGAPVALGFLPSGHTPKRDRGSGFLVASLLGMTRFFEIGK